MASINDSEIDKPQRGRPKRAELPDVNVNTGAQSINTERNFQKYHWLRQKQKETRKVHGLHTSYFRLFH